MSYLEEKLSEIQELVNSEEPLIKKASEESLQYGKELVDLADNVEKIANDFDITLSDLRNFLYKQGEDDQMNRESLIKTASILRAVAKHINDQNLKKEAEYKNIIQDKLKTLGVNPDKDKVEKIAKNKDIAEIFKSISAADDYLKVGSSEDASEFGGGDSADDRFLKWLGL